MDSRNLHVVSTSRAYTYHIFQYTHIGDEMICIERFGQCCIYKAAF